MALCPSFSSTAIQCRVERSKHVAPVAGHDGRVSVRISLVLRCPTLLVEMFLLMERAHACIEVTEMVTGACYNHMHVLQVG